MCVACVFESKCGWGLGFLGGASGRESACPQKTRRRGFDPWVGKIPWRRKWHLTPVLVPGESHGQRSLAGYSPWVHKESDTTQHTGAHSLLTTRPSECNEEKLEVETNSEFKCIRQHKQK